MEEKPGSYQPTFYLGKKYSKENIWAHPGCRRIAAN